MRLLTHGVVVSALGVAAVIHGAAPAAAAANPQASCVGIIVSNLAPAGAFDVDDFKAIGESFGTPNFGQFVRVGASQHFGSLQQCMPAPLP